MKKTNLYIVALAVAAMAAGCSEERFETTGEGKLLLSASVNTDLKVVSRADAQDLSESCIIWISSDKGLVRRYNGIGEVPAEGIALTTGSYVAEAWAGDSVSASFEKRAFKGYQTFTVEAGKSTSVDLVCGIANVAASVVYAEGIEDVLSDFTMTVGHDRGSLIFEGRDERVGYYMMPSTDKNLTYTLKGTQRLDGKPFEYTGVIENAEPGTQYELTVKYTPVTEEFGGAVFTITVDNTTIEVNNKVQIVAAPKIELYGGDISAPVMGEPANIGRQTVYISSATRVTNLDIQGEELRKIDILRGDICDLLNINEQSVAALAAAGINFKVNEVPSESDPTDMGTLIQVNFEDSFTNNLSEGTYPFTFTVVDDLNNRSTATLTFSVSNAPVQTLDAGTVAHHDAVLRGVIAKEGVSSTGFNYRAQGTSAWSHIDATINGSEFTAEVSGLKGNTTYEYAATAVTEAGDYVSPVVCTFTTLDDQLPNSSFELTSTHDDGSVMFSANPKKPFWDSGNHGSQKMGKNITTADTSVKHSGNSSAKLNSQFVGVGSFGKFAAGNIFAGEYLKTDGMDGILGWGHPFTLSPKEVKVWIKYRPVNVTTTTNKQISKGDLDMGCIYVALCDNTYPDGNNYNGKDWSCVVKTKKSDFKVFDSHASNIIAYGRYDITVATEGEDMVQITIPIEYYRQGVTPANIIFVASASAYGDYFEGGDGSTLWIDDVELVY